MVPVAARCETVRETRTGESQTAKCIIKAQCSATVKTLNETLDSYLKRRLCKHIFNLRHQFKAARTLKDTLQNSEAVIHIDLSENYQCGYSREVQSAHFGASKSQITLHTGVLYTSKQSNSFCTVSDSKHHDACDVWAHLAPVLAHLKDTDSSITCVHFESDSPSGQYCNKLNAYLMSTIPFEMGFDEVSWIFYEAGHGKGAPDGVGAAVKRNADDLISHGKDVLSARNLHDQLLPSTSIKLFLVAEEEITGIEKSLPSTIQPVAGLMKVHQINCTAIGVIDSFRLSCFCDRRNIPCTCLKPVRTLTIPSPAPARCAKSRRMKTRQKRRCRTAECGASKCQKQDPIDCSSRVLWVVVKKPAWWKVDPVPEL